MSNQCLTIGRVKEGIIDFKIVDFCCSEVVMIVITPKIKHGLFAGCTRFAVGSIF